MAKASPMAERLGHLEKAKNCFLKASAALTEPYTGNNLGHAVVLGSLGLHHLAQADDDQRGLEFAENYVAAARGERDK